MEGGADWMQWQNACLSASSGAGAAKTKMWLDMFSLNRTVVSTVEEDAGELGRRVIVGY